MVHSIPANSTQKLVISVVYGSLAVAELAVAAEELVRSPVGLASLAFNLLDLGSGGSFSLHGY